MKRGILLLLSVVSFQLSAFSQYVPRYDGGGGGGGGGVIDGQQLFDGSHVLAADFGARTLKADDGTTEMATWKEAANAVNIYLGDSVNRPTFEFFVQDAAFVAGDGATRGATLGVDGLTNWYGDAFKNIDLLARKLYNPDGTTVAIDYGTDFTVNLGPSGEGSIYNDPTGGTGGGAYKDIIFQIQTGKIDIEYDSGDSVSNKFEIYSFLATPLELYGDGGIDIQAPSGQFVTIHGDNIKVPSLPTSDPVVVGQLWNNAGTLKVSAGP